LTSQFKTLTDSMTSLIAFSKRQEEKIEFLQGTLGVVGVGVGVVVVVNLAQFGLSFLKK
jgi:hypothetical protein